MTAASQFSLRTWATPVTIGSFVLMGISGVLMFFDVVPGYLVFAHEWFSWIFLVGTGAHIAVNYRAFARHLKSEWGRASVAIFAVLLLASTYSFGRITAPQLKWPISEALVDAPLSALAGVVRTNPGQLVARLEAKGITATPDQNIRDLAAAYGIDEFHILGLVMLPDR
jgi:hypothetical protein